MNYALAALAFIAGGLVALQFGVNATWRGVVEANPFYATLVSYAVGTISSLLCLLAIRPEAPSLARVFAAPWWAWLGGAIGVGYVSISIVAAPRLGATTLMILIIAGQLLASVVFDHFGLIGYPVRPINLWRVAGCVLLVGAVVLIKMS